MAAEMPYPDPADLDLTVTGGGGDAERTGYWTVTGPQDPRQVNAIVELARHADDGHTFYAWYLNRRMTPEYNATDAGTVVVAYGFQPSYEAALEDLREAWVEQVGIGRTA